MDITLNKIKDIIKKEIGLDASTLGDATIDKILQQRMYYCRLENIDDYYHFLVQHNDELAALLETAVIPETWFFRDTRPFNLLVEHIKQQQNTAVKPCNILCIPCSTGEEPYSIAMHLLHAGINANTFNIQAIDISAQALSLAKQAVYGQNSFRNEIAKEYRKFYFDQGNGKDLLKDNIKCLIKFAKTSILNDAELQLLDTKFDFIFCRNLLIYFDLKTKEKAFKNLHSIMCDDGMLFIGHSEFGAVPEKLFTICNASKAFGLIKYNKDNSTPQKKPPTANNKIYKNKFNKAETPAVLSFKTLIKKNTKPLTQPEHKKLKQSDDLLTQARNFADQKKLSEAESCCFEFIDQYGDNAESFFILGLINETAEHKNMAEDFFRKAIYLKPKHYESLLHLALLLKSNGDHKSSELFMKRAQRIGDN